MARDEQSTGKGASRRRVLRSLALGGAVGSGALSGCFSDSGGSTTAEASPRFVLSTALSGPYGPVGEYERRGFELAVRHLNQGGGLVDDGPFDSLGGDGVLGRSVDPVVLGTESSADVARSNLEGQLGAEATAMCCGGIAGSVVDAHRDVAVEHDVPYLVGASLLRDLAGRRCASQVFRELYTSSAVLDALEAVLGREIGPSMDFVQVYTDTPEGRDLTGAVTDHFFQESTLGWQARGRRAVMHGSTDYSQAMQRVASSRPDVVVLNLFGLDAVNAVVAARNHLSSDTPVVVPHVEDSLPNVAGDALSDLHVVGTTPWHQALDAPAVPAYRDAFVDAASSAAGGTPTGASIAHVVYTQTLHFAAAAERAGSFDPLPVRSELVDSEYDVGLGPQRLQVCNQQATRPVPVVRSTAEGTFQLVETVTDAVADCGSSPATACSL